jgi:hypothetical protein
VVYGREVDGQATTFGTTGYTYNNVFVLYDRTTESVWYPLSEGAIDAIGGRKRGDRIEVLDEPQVVTLEEWRRQHPDTKVLLGERAAAQSADSPEPTQPADG